jgi:hypothetical protein
MNGSDSGTYITDQLLNIAKYVYVKDFYKVVEFCWCGIILIFLFSGPSRSRVKRQHSRKLESYMF